MKILHVNTNDIEGGAARAANRLHKGLLHNNIYSRMLVLNKKTDDFTVLTLETNKQRKLKAKIRLFKDEKIKALYPQRLRKPWSCNLFRNRDLINFINRSDFDLVNFHWINAGMLSVKDIKNITKPIVWTMHDMWPFTGGCHYTGICEQYKTICTKCYQLSKEKTTFLSKLIFDNKVKSYKNVNIVCVSPSKWLAECAKKSYLLKNKKIVVIQNGLDLSIYKNIDKNTARNLLNLDKDKKYVLFGAMSSTSDKRKGYDLLKKALSILKQNFNIKNIELLVFGASKPERIENLGFNITYLGQINDDVYLNILYNCADVFVAPSREDNLPNTVVEAISCGLPVVAFDIGGMPDIIEHKENGYLAVPFNEAELAKGINFMLESKEKWNMLSQNALKKAKQTYDINLVSQKYIDLYKSILNV